MLECSFELNNKPMSAFTLNQKAYAAFSGLGNSVNDASATCHKDAGPIPKGSYYILDRQSGGRLGFLYKLLKPRTDWFALYAMDNQIDDFTDWCDDIIRGQFRLHPKGTSGISRGCIVIDNAAQFREIASYLRNRQPTVIPNTELTAWAKVTVK